MLKSAQKITELVKNPLFINSSWGIISQVVQSLLLSLFFILIARNYTTQIFANFIIATVLYQLLTAFSSLGLSQWFIREIAGNDKREIVINRFIKLQFYSGVTFYFINIALSYLLYNDRLIHILTLLLGINIIFDNLINSIKWINISEFKQKKSFIIQSTETLLKFIATCFLLITPFSIITLSIILIVIRFATLNLFLSLGSSKLINFKLLLLQEISLKYVKQLVIRNWPFIIIGSVSIINWRISTIIISKALSSIDVANYEISYRIFSLAQMLPIAISTTVFPTLVILFNKGKNTDLSTFYRKVHVFYLLFGILSFTFIYSFIDFLLPSLFGLNYAGTGIYTKQMFLTILVFPTAFLQSNVLVAMKYEKWDMWFNVISLIINFSFCIIGIYFFKSLSVINISIFSGFLIFHILQDIILVNKKISSLKHVLEFYILSAFSILSYVVLDKLVNSVFLFVGYWLIILSLYFGITKFQLISKTKIFTNTIIKKEDKKKIPEIYSCL